MVAFSEYTGCYNDQALRLTQHTTLSATGNGYRPGAVAVLCGWEDNRRSGVAPAMRHRLWYIHLWAQSPKEGR